MEKLIHQKVEVFTTYGTRYVGILTELNGLGVIINESTFVPLLNVKEIRKW
jgi:hypothetical protein